LSKFRLICDMERGNKIEVLYTKEIC
jgi:hypothetical protein